MLVKKLSVFLFLIAVSSNEVLAQWIESGVSICNSVYDQWFHKTAADGAGGALFVWRDYRHGDTNPDVFINSYITDINMIGFEMLIN